MSDERSLSALGPCYVHGGIFEFDPDRVLSVMVDPVTNRPPDVDAEGNTIELSMEDFRAAVDRAVKKPVCPDCVEKLNATRARRGLGPLRASI